MFLDVLSVATGAHFESVIETTIASADVVLVMIGDRWEIGTQRDSVIDYVELEVGFALAQGKRVIPVLLGQRPMPRRDALVGSLAELGSINAHRVRVDPDFRSDASELIKLIGEPTPTVQPHTTPLQRKRQRQRRAAVAVITAGLVATGALLTFVATRSGSDPSISPDTPESSVGTPSSVDDPSSQTTVASDTASLYPVTDAATRELYADSLSDLPGIAVQVTGYKPGRGEQYDTVRLFDKSILIPPLFEQVTGGMHECYRLYWIIRWQSDNPEVKVHAEVRAMPPFIEAEDRPTKPPALAGYLAGNACEVAGFWFGTTLNGNDSNLVDVQYRMQVFDKLPTDLELPRCTPLVENEAIPLELCDEGTNVRRVQQALVRLGVASLKIDGQFGPATKSAVEAFQLKMGLPVDGIVTSATWKALFPNEEIPTG